MTQFVLFSGAGKVRLAQGMRQLTRDVKLDARTLNFISDVTFATLRKTSNKGRYATLNVKNEKK